MLDSPPTANLSSIPTMFARVGEHIYFHGSAASRTLRGAADGLPVCITVTLSDGLVLARSVFNHSMNYRSVVALGTAVLVADPAEKLQALQAFTEKLIPGRWNDARQPNEKELKATSILKLPSRKFPQRFEQVTWKTTPKITRCKCGPASFRCDWSPILPSATNAATRQFPLPHTPRNTGDSP